MAKKHVTPQQVAAPIYAAIRAARDPGSIKGAKISATETRTISKAMDKALSDGFDKLTLEETFEELPYAAGFGVMQEINQKEFARRQDFRSLWNKAVDIASAAPDIGNYA